MSGFGRWIGPQRELRHAGGPSAHLTGLLRPGGGRRRGRFPFWMRITVDGKTCAERPLKGARRKGASPKHVYVEGRPSLGLSIDRFQGNHARSNGPDGKSKYEVPPTEKIKKTAKQLVITSYAVGVYGEGLGGKQTARQRSKNYKVEGVNRIEVLERRRRPKKMRRGKPKSEGRNAFNSFRPQPFLVPCSQMSPPPPMAHVSAWTLRDGSNHRPDIQEITDILFDFSRIFCPTVGWC